MIVIDTLVKLEEAALSNLVVALGNFDGVHLGHRKLLTEALDKARELRARSAVITFEPHPLKVIDPSRFPKLLTTVEQRIEHFAAMGIDIVVLLPFNKELSGLTPREFAQNVLQKKLGAIHACVGFNYTFGRGGKSGPEELRSLGKELGFGVSEVTPQAVEGVLVSSTEIRACLEQGDIERAQKYLGYWPSVAGIVVSGDRRGRTLGYPTANVQPPADNLVPARGVYAGWVKYRNRQYPAMVNIGLKPTFKDSDESTIEAHIFDFDKDIYEENVEVVFRLRLREEQKFADIKQLLIQLELDAQETCKVLQYIKYPYSNNNKEYLSV
ncbi:MAG TPA: bifunctional riboflavin kinase/FAD synthetase [Candidatus Deferrimicrobium sp.]|nr:bifunctional riboflavin kinase/FAD synthetase [Candidatus Deferrimicrobium sp.]